MSGTAPGDRGDFKGQGHGSDQGPRLNLPDNSAGFRVYLNGTDNTNFIHVKFGKVQEVESSGKVVPEHRIMALEALSSGLEQGACVLIAVWPPLLHTW